MTKRTHKLRYDVFNSATRIASFDMYCHATEFCVSQSRTFTSRWYSIVNSITGHKRAVWRDGHCVESSAAERLAARNEGKVS